MKSSPASLIHRHQPSTIVALLLAGSLAACGPANETSGEGGGGTAAAPVDMVAVAGTDVFADSAESAGGLETEKGLSGSYRGSRNRAQVTTAPAASPAPATSPAPVASPAPAGSPVATPSAAPSPSPTPTPTPSPAPAPTSGTVGSVDQMIADMTQRNDAVLKGVNPVYGWAHGPGYNYMGNDPRWTNTPNWWKSSNPNYYTSGYWPYILPWVVMFEGEGNRSSNTRINVRNLKLYIKSKSTGQWSLISSADGVDGYACPQTSNYFSCDGPRDFRDESGGGMSVRPYAGYNFHGWFGGRKPINGADIAAVHATLQARLVVNDASKADDRSVAQYLIHSGADYYPVDGSAGTVVPAVAISRAKQLSSNWQAISMTTLTDAGIQEPGGGISSAQLRASPPPMD